MKIFPIFFLILFSCNSKTITEISKKKEKISQITKTPTRTGETLKAVQQNARKQKVITCCEISSGNIGTVSDIENEMVYVFTKKNKQWVKTGVLRANHPDEEDGFGWSVDIEDDLIVVGAPRESSCAKGINGDQTNNDCDDSRFGRGAVYLFGLKEGKWIQKAYFKESNGGFGSRVILQAGRIFASAPDQGDCRGHSHDDLDCLVGGVYIYHFHNGKWRKEASLPKIPIPESQFGYHIQPFNEILLVQGKTTTLGESDDSYNHLSIFIYERKGKKWNQKTIGIDEPFVFLPNANIGKNYLAVTIGKLIEDSEQMTNIHVAGISVYNRVKGEWKRIGFIPGTNEIYNHYDQALQSLSVVGNKLTVYDGITEKTHLLSSF